MRRGADGVSDVVRGVQHFQTENGKEWWREFVRFYPVKRKCDLSESRWLQSLTPKVARVVDDPAVARRIASAAGPTFAAQSGIKTKRVIKKQ